MTQNTIDTPEILTEEVQEKPSQRRRRKQDHAEKELDLTAAELSESLDEEIEHLSASLAPQVSFNGISTMSPALLEELRLLGEHLSTEVYVLFHGRGQAPDSHNQITDNVYAQFRNLRRSITGKRVILVLDSPGGHASAAYKIARLFQQASQDFMVAVPRWAMSAATLLSLGAREIHMSSDSQLGPLDVQLHDREREEWSSALDEVQSLDQITAAAIAQADQAMLFLMQRSGKKIETLIPHALDFAAKLQAPMVSKIDTIHYSQQSRLLKVAQDYAERLLAPNYGPNGMEIAQRLVHNYPEHGFVIDPLEAREIGLSVPADEAAIEILDRIGVLIDMEAPIAFGKLEVESIENTHSDTDQITVAEDPAEVRG